MKLTIFLHVVQHTLLFPLELKNTFFFHILHQCTDNTLHTVHTEYNSATVQSSKVNYVKHILALLQASLNLDIRLDCIAGKYTHLHHNIFPYKNQQALNLRQCTNASPIM